MDTTNGLEQAQVWSPQALTLGNGDNHGDTRVNGFMYWVAQSWDEAARCTLLGDSMAGECVPLLIGLGEMARDGGQYASEKSACIFRDTEEA
jgi:hypothetical protein